MKTQVGLVIFAIVLASFMASCSEHSCPTYDNARGRSASMASVKKSKPSKNRTPFYKTAKLAEQD